MPRNSSGVYQLPAGNPVVSGSLIESDWANNTMSDIAIALTNSLDRLGSSTMAAPLLINDGTISAPGVAFGAESSTGLYRKSTKVLGVTVGGAESFEISNLLVTSFKPFAGTNATFSGTLNVAGATTLAGTLNVAGATTLTGPVSFTGALALPNGTAPAPALSFTSDPTTGLYRSGANTIGLATNGLFTATLGPAGFNLAPALSYAGAGSASGSFAVAATDTTGGIRLTGKSAVSTWVDLDPQPDNGAAGGTDAALVRLFRFTTTTGARNFTIFRGDGSTLFDHVLSAGTAGLVAQIGRSGGRVTFGAQADDGVSDFQTSGLARINGSAYGQLGVRDTAAYGGTGPNVAFDGIVLDSSASTGISILTAAGASAGLAFGDTSSNLKGKIQYDNSTDVFRMATAGTDRLVFGATGFQISPPILAPDGTAAAPAYAFTAQASSGLFRTATGLGVSFAGAEKMRVLSNTDASVLIGATAPLAASAGRGLLELNGATSSYYVCDIAGAIGAVFGHDGTNLSIQAQLGVMRFLTGGAEKGRFTTSTDPAFLVGQTSPLFGSAGRSVLELNGTSSAVFALNTGGAAGGNLGHDGTFFHIQASTGYMRFTAGGHEAARFTAAAQSEFLLGITAPVFSAAGRGLLEINGTANGFLALEAGGTAYATMQGDNTGFLVSSRGSVALRLGFNGTEIARVDTDSKFKAGAGPWELGYRQIPQSSTTAGYTLKATDVGKCVVVTTAGNVVGAAVFVAGDVLSIFNAAGANIALVSTGMTVNYGVGASPSTGNRTLAANAYVTLYFTANNVCKIIGDGIS